MIAEIKKKIKSFFTIQKNITIKAGTGISASIPNNGGGYFTGGKFASGLSRSAPVVIHDHFSLRQQARDMMIDSMEGHSLIETLVDTIVDAGLVLKPTPIASMLGMDDEQLSEWSEDVAKSFHLWAKSKKSHRSRISNFYQNQWLYQLSQQRDNDIFVRFFYGRDKDTFNPLQIEFVDANNINGYAYTSTYTQDNGDSDGITRDEAGREIAYKIWYLDKQGKMQSITVPAIGEKSGRIFMIHGFRPEYARQGRGFTRMAHILQELENLTDFKTAVIKKAIAQASLTMAVENNQQDASNPVEGRVAGPREYGDTETEIEESNTDGYSVTPNYTTIPEATINEPGVGVFNLKRGDELKFLQDTSPSQSYDSFEKAFFASIVASMGTSEEVVRKRFSDNYSASRATLILCWRNAVIWRNEMESDFLEPVYEMWLSEEIAAGRVSCPGWSDPRLRAAWLNAEWAGSTMPNIDPLKQSEADKNYVELASQTLDDVARNFNNSSGKANRSKLAKQYEELPEPAWGWKSSGGGGAVDKAQEPEKETNGIDKSK